MIHYKWKEELPFYKNGKITIKNSNDLITLIPTSNYQIYTIKDIQTNDFLIGKSIYYEVSFQKK